MYIVTDVTFTSIIFSHGISVHEASITGVRRSAVQELRRCVVRDVAGSARQRAQTEAHACWHQDCTVSRLVLRYCV